MFKIVSYLVTLIVVPLFQALLYLIVGIWNLPSNLNESSLVCYLRGRSMKVKADDQYKDYKSVI